jgi:hypothetical protein
MAMRAQKVFGALAAVAALTLVSADSSRAGGDTKIRAHESGSCINIPLDPDADSCTTTGGVTTCTDFSVDCTLTTTGTGFSTVQFVGEYDPVSGTGCIISGASAPIAGCTLSGSSEKGCEFRSVGAAGVYRVSPSGDLFFTTESDTVCEDLSTGPPFNYTVTGISSTITGGTGKLAGATGTLTEGGHGQVLLSDPTLHGLGWFEGTAKGTITTP